MSIALAPAYGTPEWLEWRKGGLGASDLPAILNVDPYRTEHEIWEQKTGRVPASPGNPKTRWGHRLEAVGLEVWEAEHGYVPTPSTRVFTDLGHPHLWATPDAIAAAVNVGVEVKVTGAWLTPPERVRVQALAQAGLAHLDRVDIVRLSFDDDPAIFPIERDEAAIRDILEAGEAWYVHHVLGGVEPERRPDEAPADERQSQLAADLRSVRKAMELLERQERSIKADIVASVAGRGVITGTGWRIEVRAAHDTTRTSWSEVAATYRDVLFANGMDVTELDAIASDHQTTKRTGAAVYPTWDEEGAA